MARHQEHPTIIPVVVFHIRAVSPVAYTLYLCLRLTTSQAYYIPDMHRRRVWRLALRIRACTRPSSEVARSPTIEFAPAFNDILMFISECLCAGSTAGVGVCKLAWRFDVEQVPLLRNGSTAFTVSLLAT